MARSHLNEPVTKAKVAVALVNGVSHKDISKQFNTSPSALTAFKQRNRKLIEMLQQDFIAKALPDAQRTAKRLIKQYSHPKARNKLPHDIRQHAHQHTMEALKAAGVYPGNTSVSIGKLELTDKSQHLNVNAIPEEKLFEKLMKLR